MVTDSFGIIELMHIILLYLTLSLNNEMAKPYKYLSSYHSLEIIQRNFVESCNKKIMLISYYVGAFCR